MTKKQIPKLAGVLVEHQEYFAALPDVDAQWAIRNPIDAIALMVEAVKNRQLAVFETLKLLLGSAVTIASIPAMAGRFVVQENFAKYRGNNFDEWFLGKFEDPIGETALYSRTLRRDSKDPAIIAALGGNLKARITLAEINTAKESGALKKDKAYICYVEDEIRFPTDEAFSYFNEKGEKCVLRSVRVGWDDDGWDARASSVGDPHGEIEGDHILSRNSLES